MANLTVTPGYTFTNNEPLTLAHLNALGAPTVSTADVSAQDFETSETLTAAGACSLTKRVTLLNQTVGGPFAMTLAAGSYTGHEKFVLALNGASSAVFNLTVSSAGNGLGVLVFPSAATDRGVLLKWDGAAWQWVGTGDVYEEKTGTGTASGFGVTVLDKNSSTATLTLPAGTFKGQRKRVIVKTAGCVWTVSGTFANSVTSTTMESTAVNDLDLVWDGAAWQGDVGVGAPAASSSSVSVNRVLTAGAGWVDLVPAGAVMSFAMNSAPTGWLACNGAAVSRTTYARLFDAISTVHGVGDGSTTFNVPDLRGMFIRGVGTHGTETTAVSGSFGAVQTDQNAEHTHTVNTGALIRISPTAGGEFDAGGGLGEALVINNSGGTEARPNNIALLYCIKT